MDIEEVMKHLIRMSEEFEESIGHEILSEDTICFHSSPKYYELGRGVTLKYSPVFDFVAQLEKIDGCDFDLLEEEKTADDKDMAILHITIK